MRSHLRPFSKSSLAAALMASSLLFGFSPNSGALAQVPAAPQVEGNRALGVEQARAAATAILEAVKSRDANRRYEQFADELKAVTSPSMVERTMRSQPSLLSWKLLSINRGLRHTTVEAALTTTAGVRDLFIVLNDQAKIIGYHVDRSDDASSLVATTFVKTLAAGQYISARSYLSLALQKEISPASLQQKWQELQQITGNFVRVKKSVEANSTSNARLVLVVTEFNRLTDDLFVILDNHNQIIGVDFPIDPLKPQPVH